MKTNKCLVVFVALIAAVLALTFMVASTSRPESKVIPPASVPVVTATATAFPTSLPTTEPEPPAPSYSEEDVELLAIAIYREAGGDACCDECRYRVGDVILNRVADSRFPDTIEEVLTQPHQYGNLSVTGVVWPERAQYDVEQNAVARAYETARNLLSDERHSDLYGLDYVFQSENVQGESGFWCDGTYFARG